MPPRARNGNNRGTRRFWTTCDKLRAINELQNSNRKESEIAREMGCQRGQVSRWAKDKELLAARAVIKPHALTLHLGGVTSLEAGNDQILLEWVRSSREASQGKLCCIKFCISTEMTEWHLS